MITLQQNHHFDKIWQLYIDSFHFSSGYCCREPAWRKMLTATKKGQLAARPPLGPHFEKDQLQAPERERLRDVTVWQFETECGLILPCLHRSMWNWLTMRFSSSQISVGTLGHSFWHLCGSLKLEWPSLGAATDKRWWCSSGHWSGCVRGLWRCWNLSSLVVWSND